MKNVLLFVITASMIGCGGSNSLPQPTGIIVTITRSVLAKLDPGIKISCNSAMLNYSSREIIIKNPTYIGSIWNGNGWVTKISIKENALIISVPEDANYDIYINEQFNLLPKKLEKK
jgi:hypothetical protein